MTTFKPLPFLAAATAWLLTTAGPAWADDGARAAPVPVPPLVQQECGSCHVPFAPGLLPAASWQRLMQGLPRHFGSDASLDAGPAREIGAWFERHAGTYKKVRREGGAPPPQDRISMAPWFVREHREVAAATWRSPAVKSPANCAACHPRAEQGAFDERDIRIPR